MVGKAPATQSSGLRSLKRERRSGATIPKVAAPKVDVSNAISAEFTDFDDGPANVKSALESEFGDFEDGPAKVQEDDGGDSRGSRKAAVEEATERRNAGGPDNSFSINISFPYEKVR